MDKVNSFISRFTCGGKFSQVIEAFTCGCCYWFAYILCTRFAEDGAEMVYDQIINHFGALICGRVYDITGDVTDQYSWESWRGVDDTVLVSHITRDCIVF